MKPFTRENDIRQVGVRTRHSVRPRAVPRFVLWGRTLCHALCCTSVNVHNATCEREPHDEKFSLLPIRSDEFKGRLFGGLAWLVSCVAAERGRAPDDRSQMQSPCTRLFSSKRLLPHRACHLVTSYPTPPSRQIKAVLISRCKSAWCDGGTMRHHARALVDGW